MSAIAKLLDNVFEVNTTLAAVNAEVEASIPQALRDRQACLTTELADLKAEVKDKAKFIPDSQAHTLRGKLHTETKLVWKIKANYKVDPDALAATIDKSAGIADRLRDVLNRTDIPDAVRAELMNALVESETLALEIQQSVKVEDASGWALYLK